MATPAHKLPSAWELFGISYELVRKNLKLFLVIFSVTIASTLISVGQQIQDSQAEFSWKGVATNSVFGPSFNDSSIKGLALLVAAFTVVGLVFSLMSYILTLRSAQDKHPNFDNVWSEFKKKGLKLFLLFICLVIAIGVGFVLLIIPGIILLWRFSMAPYLMIDKNTDISESFAQSWEITKGHGKDIYTIYLMGILLSLPSLIPFLGVLITLGLTIAYSCAMPLRYEQIKHRPRKTHAS